MGRAGRALLAALFASASAAASEWSGWIAAEGRTFGRDDPSLDRRGAFAGIAAQPEYRRSAGAWNFDFKPFGRWDSGDSERTHADVRELTATWAGQGLEAAAGLGRVFWGVTESQHLVDVVNQTDLVEDPDGEEKLGQPMVRLSLFRWGGALQAFLLPGFRERTFPGRKGRLRPTPPVEEDQATYDARRGRGHMDAAVRLAVTRGPWDAAVSHFYGTSREPLFRTDADKTVFIPHYDLIHQTGLDAQATLGRCLWKLEAIRRSGQGNAFNAATAGFEYTVATAFDSPIDVGLIGEYMYDDRGRDALTPFQEDLMTGLRLAFNDAQAAEALFGLIADRRDKSRILSLEASRRVGRSCKLTVKGRAYLNVPKEDVFTYDFRHDDFLKMELAYHF